MALPALDPSEIRDWLASRHRSEIRGLEALPAGYWSAAFGYEVDGRELVLRVGTQPEGFVMDRLAHEYRRPGLPIPEVLDVGEVFGVAYAYLHAVPRTLPGVAHTGRGGDGSSCCARTARRLADGRRSGRCAVMLVWRRRKRLDLAAMADGLVGR